MCSTRKSLDHSKEIQKWDGPSHPFSDHPFTSKMLEISNSPFFAMFLTLAQLNLVWYDFFHLTLVFGELKPCFCKAPYFGLTNFYVKWLFLIWPPLGRKTGVTTPENRFFLRIAALFFFEDIHFFCNVSNFG